MKWFAIPLAMILGAPALSLAWEVDNVTCRYSNLQDVGTQTNAETNRRIRQALEKANNGGEELLDGMNFPPSLSKKRMESLRRRSKVNAGGSSGSSGGMEVPESNETEEQIMARRRAEAEQRRQEERAELKYENTPEGCDPQKAMNALRGAIASAHMDNMETWAMGANISKCEVKPKDSVYQDFTLFESPVMRGFAGLNSVIQINGVKIGADKMSHFMTEGFEYYMNQRRGKNLREVIQQGIEEEEGGYGLKATGIKSYADMTANYQGYTFWRQVLEGNDPYLKCENGKWKMAREFRWEDYVIAGMDESVNCNSYKTDAMQKKVETRTSALVAAKDPGNANKICPMDPEGCRQTLAAIREPAAAAVVIHPACRRAGENMMSGTNSQPEDGVR